MKDSELRDIIGASAYRDYEKASDYNQGRVRGWAVLLQGMTDAGFYRDAVVRVGAAAVANSRSLPNAPEWIYAFAVQHESARRHRLAGHQDRCLGGSLYDQAHAEAMEEFGLTPLTPSVCTCTGGRS